MGQFEGAIYASELPEDQAEDPALQLKPHLCSAPALPYLFPSLPYRFLLRVLRQQII